MAASESSLSVQKPGRFAPYLLRNKESYCFVPAESERKRNVERRLQSKDADDTIASPPTGQAITKTSAWRPLHKQ